MTLVKRLDSTPPLPDEVRCQVSVGGLPIAEIRVSNGFKEDDTRMRLIVEYGAELKDDISLRVYTVLMSSLIDGPLENPMLRLLCALEELRAEIELGIFRTVAE